MFKEYFQNRREESAIRKMMDRFYLDYEDNMWSVEDAEGNSDEADEFDFPITNEDARLLLWLKNRDEVSEEFYENLKNRANFLINWGAGFFEADLVWFVQDKFHYSLKHLRLYEGCASAILFTYGDPNLNASFIQGPDGWQIRNIWNPDLAWSYALPKDTEGWKYF